MKPYRALCFGAYCSVLMKNIPDLGIAQDLEVVVHVQVNPHRPNIKWFLVAISRGFVFSGHKFSALMNWSKSFLKENVA